MKEKNALVEFNRFLFALTVALMHFFVFFEIEPQLFRGGFLSVEFFFVIAGYFLGASADKHLKESSFLDRQKYVVSFAKSRLKRIYPLYLLALLITLFSKSILSGTGLKGMAELFKNCLAEFFMLQWTPLGNEILEGVLWYVPAFFFASLLLTVIASFFGKHLSIFGLMICPVVSFIIYGYFFKTIGKIDIMISYYGIMRALAGLTAGIFIFYLITLTDIKRSIVFAYAGQIILIFIFIFESFAHRNRVNFLIIALFIISSFLIFIGKTDFNDKTKRALVFLGSLSYPIYVFHMPLYNLLKIAFKIS
ncbi:MAG TPA: hypothetical protein DCG85_03325 [Lachnospiraceae bacterium]|nr:hypothetical protein [Lachnospiraceae bacterium]